MPEIRCPGYPKCKRHFKTAMGMKGHVIACAHAATHVLKRPVGVRPSHVRASKIPERVIFCENHEMGNDKICRQNITIYTPDCLLHPRFS